MASLLDQALSSVGITNDTNGAIGATLGLTRALDLWGESNAGLPTSGVGKAVRDIIDSNIPPIFRNNPNPQGLQFQSKGGEWTALHYADDLVAHHPKFKFIFKVMFEGFEGFGNKDFYYFVHRCDKPNILFEHQDVNYYNFRTRVLTKTVFQPMSIVFLDEIGNSVNDFFVKYIGSLSGQASGKWGIDTGFGQASSSMPYKRGYSNGKAIIINQIFANGLFSNQFKFVNPRIESFQFDELNMEDNAGSLVTLQFTYDALVSSTVNVGGEGAGNLYTWGNTDILKGGGTSGLPNAGATSMGEGGIQQATSANGGSLLQGLGLQKYSNAVKQVVDAGVTQYNSVVDTLKDLVSSPAITASTKAVVGSSETTLSRGISDTLTAIKSGANFSTASILGLGGTATAVTVGSPPGSPSLSTPPFNSQGLPNTFDTSALTLTAEPSNVSYAQPLSIAQIAVQAGISMRGPSSTVTGP